MLGTEFEIDELERERFKLKLQMQIVSKKVAVLITKNADAFNSQTAHYADIEADASAIAAAIAGIRVTLARSRAECITALRIVANQRERKFLSG